MNELSCIECHQWLHPYLDNEIGVEMATRVHAHLQQCDACQTNYKNMRLLRENLQKNMPFYDMPELAQRRILSKLPALHHTQWFTSSFAAVAMAASVFLFFATPSAQEILINEVVSSHVRSLQEQHLMDVASSDKHTVKPWFAGKLDFSPPVADLQKQGYPLIGGRLDYIDQQNVAALAYKRHQHVINVFVIPTAESDSTTSVTSRRGYNIVSWRKNHMRFEAISDLNTKELSDFSQLILLQN